MVTRIKKGYYKIGETARGKGIYVMKGKAIFDNLRHLGGILRVYKTRWYLLLSWYNGKTVINDVVKEVSSKKEGVKLGSSLRGKEVGRWKEASGSL